MKLRILQLSDMHLNSKKDAFSINIDKIKDALRAEEKTDECVIVLSGDLASKGKGYEAVGSLVGGICKTVSREFYNDKYLEVLCIPGNHDIDFKNLNKKFEDIESSLHNNTIDETVNEYLINMNDFFDFAKSKKCFTDDKIVSKRVIKFGNCKVGFVMLNTAPLSLLGGNSIDMGCHYISKRHLEKIAEATEAECNILVMHHSIEWLCNSCKDELRKILAKKYNLLFTGHEHETVGETRNINKNGNIQCIQGNAMLDATIETNGFCTATINFDNMNFNAKSYIWRENFYSSKDIINNTIRTISKGDIVLKQEFHNNLINETFFVFPGFIYDLYSEDDEEMQRFLIEKENMFYKKLEMEKRVIIIGEHNSGKTTLAKRTFDYFYNSGKYPLLLKASDINKKEISKIIKNVFEEQYEEDNNAFEKYTQVSKNDKIVIIDESEMIKDAILKRLIEYLCDEEYNVIMFSEKKVDFDLQKKVIDSLAEQPIFELSIRPFLYNRRKMLIEKLIKNKYVNIQNIKNEVKKINDIINTQVKFFDLNPEFIINFVDQYESDNSLKFSSGMNVFNVVYETSIKKKIITNSSSNNIDATLVLNVLREIAYYIHFKKTRFFSFDDISSISKKYSEEYRQNINVRTFLNSITDAKIVIEYDGDNNIYMFKDYTLVAYFVAQAINQKYNQVDNEDKIDAEKKLQYLLTNLCFGINSDILLFLSLITNNPKFINIIINGAKNHFDDQKELRFEENNIEFILDTNIEINESLPDKKEKIKREEIISKQEESSNLEHIELKDEYDYSEEDISKFENQMMTSFKYLEIISKALPAFCNNMKVAQQDKLVELVYKCPNKFIYMMLNNIENNFEQIINHLYNEIVELRQEKDIAEINIASVKKMLKQISFEFIVSIYQLVTNTCTSDQSFRALNYFEIDKSSNYELMNLMMETKNKDIVAFSEKAKELDKRAKYDIEKTIIKYSVRNYFLINDVEMYSTGQSLFDYFFGNKNKKMKSNFNKKKIYSIKDK